MIYNGLLKKENKYNAKAGKGFFIPATEKFNYN
jgi:hypothetical protein